MTSGAIGAGMAELGEKERPKLIPEQQAMAAVGQARLMAIYNRFLREYGEIGAQILLTASDLEDRKRYLNAYNTMTSLLKRGVIPIINENDTVATQEIKFGDNDTLSALVASLVDADLLIILSDVEGLYNGNPRVEKNAEKIDKVEQITPEIEALAGERQQAGDRWHADQTGCGKDCRQLRDSHGPGTGLQGIYPAGNSGETGKG